MTKEIVMQAEAYSLAEFCQKVQDAILDGYTFDFTTNERYPQAYGSYYNVAMVKTEAAVPEASKVEEPAPVEEAEAPKKRGPKPKVQTEVQE